MKTNIFIPKKIKVGFQERDDTYTKKLAYVIYYDQKGKLRKETSWQSWRDKEIEPVEFDNIPTSGFVLNKKVGDYSSGWDHRQAYCRVYDERNFEFEITIENLLYILENSNSIKGKGLEGLFVYGWDGKDLILMPTESPDYKEISQYNEIIHSNNYIKAKDLIIGATYRTKSNEEWIYMGRFDYHTTKSERVYKDSSNYRNYDWIYTNVNKGKYHYFARECEGWRGFETLVLKSLGERFIETVSIDCVENYADLFDKLECTTSYSPLDESKDEYILYTFDEFYERLNNINYNYNCYNSQKINYSIGKVYNKTGQYYYGETNKNDYNFHYKTNRREGTIQDIFSDLQPIYKNEYLTNGKLYREGK